MVKIFVGFHDKENVEVAKYGADKYYIVLDPNENAPGAQMDALKIITVKTLHVLP
jgi:hypothetical protein